MRYDEYVFGEIFWVRIYSQEILKFPYYYFTQKFREGPQSTQYLKLPPGYGAKYGVMYLFVDKKVGKLQMDF